MIRKMTTQNLTTKIRRPLATARGIRRLALTLALSLAPLTLALGAVSVVAPGVASAASGTACSGTSPLASSTPDPLEAWVYFPPSYPGGNPSVNFVFANQQVPVSFPSGYDYATLGANWGGVDNPAPLAWYASHVPNGNLGCIALGNGITYTATLISKMNAENFSPSAVGGVNPAGIISTTTSSSTPTTPTKPKGTSTPSTSTTGGATTKPSVGGSGTTPSPAPPTSTTVTSATPQPPIVLAPPSASQWRHYQEILANDQQVIALRKPIKNPLPTSHGTMWPYIVAGVIVVGVAAVVLQRRRRIKSVDEINSSLGGRRTF